MAQVLPAERDLRRVIGDADGAGDRQVEGLGEQELLEIYRSMVQLRTYDERSVVYDKQGRIGTYAIFWDHEGIQAGAFHALEDEDWIFPSYREWRSGCCGECRPRPCCRGGGVIPPAGGTPRTIESRRSAFRSRRMFRTQRASPGARSSRGRAPQRSCSSATAQLREGAFHEGANFAGVTGAPLVLFCNNNGWAISTPVEAQTRAQTLADKAVGYGMPGVRVDGTDVLACYEATREALVRARTGGSRC